mmetsp:Transcript_8340/g.12510  ORF Transcript_8340/g.12510 Transcript_8340/m.12510 type:complete len:268 (+) Transcript_8340:78-881(+)|eukprot:CAMPEP_0167744910 /NCGR_PEP_ID=MMETSP0110_2-20121227/2854_1 /TAXON_ID=629695 /ORGANISM="Gymnochlora sp., Strain CCMP2014" /LENGTH=267 /DNA_ID=CAMNT_0007629485 /DNA_START=80 /DNA_END=883 /DNA_ORIENTATION=+
MAAIRRAMRSLHSVRAFSVFSSETYRSHRKSGMQRAILPKESDVILDFTINDEVKSTLEADGFKVTKVVNEEGHTNERTEELIRDSFFRFSQRPHHDPWIDKIIIEDPAFDIPAKNTREFFLGLYKQMRPNGRMLIITRPRDGRHLPLFESAMDSWGASYPPLTFFTERLQGAGFDVKLRTEVFEVETETEHWMDEIRKRSLRSLENLDDEEIEEGIDQLRDMIGDVEHITFEEMLVMITATKAQGGARQPDTLIVQEEGPPYGHCG